MSLAELSTFLNRTSQQVTGGLQRTGTWARTKVMQIRRTRKTEENTGKRKKHARKTCHFLSRSLNKFLFCHIPFYTYSHAQRSGNAIKLYKGRCLISLGDTGLQSKNILICYYGHYG